MSDFVKGSILVPKETPAGPPAARIAWADELGQLLVVVEEQRGVLVVNCPTDGETYSRSLSDIAAEYERAEGDPLGRSWAAVIERAATDAARVDPDEYGGRESARYWQRVAAAVIRCYDEEEAARRRAAP